MEPVQSGYKVVDTRTLMCHGMRRCKAIKLAGLLGHLVLQQYFGFKGKI